MGLLRLGWIIGLRTEQQHPMHDYGQTESELQCPTGGDQWVLAGSVACPESGEQA